MAATLDVRHCKPSCNQVQATSTVRLTAPLFLFLCRFLFSSKKFAPGCPRSDNSHLARPIASPVLLVGLARSAADGPAHHHRGTGRSSQFKRLLLCGPPSAECPTDSGVPSATRFLDSP